MEDEEEPDVGNIPEQVIQEMIKELPEGYRTVLNLYAFEEKSHKEISELLGISESTSASQLHRARSLLARKINDYKKKNGIAFDEKDCSGCCKCKDIYHLEDNEGRKDE